MKANVIATILLFILCASIAYADLIPIPIGGSVDHIYNDIPFHWYHVVVVHAPPDVHLTANVYLPELFYADMVHTIVWAAWADNIPDNVVVGHIRGYYTDGSYDSLDLVMGVNIAEWAYERPENQPYLQHSMPSPAWSEWTNQDSAHLYQAHRWYAGLDTDPTKELEYLQLALAEESYTGQQYYGMGPADWFGINLHAITIEGEIIPEPSTILLLTTGLGGMTAYCLRRRKKM